MKLDLDDSEIRWILKASTSQYTNSASDRLRNRIITILSKRAGKSKYIRILNISKKAVNKSRHGYPKTAVNQAKKLLPLIKDKDTGLSFYIEDLVTSLKHVKNHHFKGNTKSHPLKKNMFYVYYDLDGIRNEIAEQERYDPL